MSDPAVTTRSGSNSSVSQKRSDPSPTDGGLPLMQHAGALNSSVTSMTSMKLYVS